VLQSSPKGGFMLLRAVFIEVVLLGIFVALLNFSLTDFKVKKRRLVVFVFPLLTYVMGFTLRLSDAKDLIDLGYFFTEFSTIFVTILFSLCMYLGQIRYWKIR
jgi:hypothetical protein